MSTVEIIPRRTPAHQERFIPMNVNQKSSRCKILSNSRTKQESATRRMTRDIEKNSCGLREALMKSKRKIVGTQRIGKLAEASSFFGNYFVEWIYSKGWVNNVGDAVTFARLMYKNKIIIAVYTFVKEFLEDAFLYKFAVDELVDSELIQKRDKSFEMAKNIYTSWARRSTTSLRGSLKIKDEIHGNILLERIDKGCNGALACQIMLRFGFISPKSKYKGRPDTQIFYAQEKYKFSSEISRNSNTRHSRLSRSISNKDSDTRRVSQSNSKDSDTASDPYEAEVVNKRPLCEPQISYSVTRKDNVLSKTLHRVTEIHDNDDMPHQAEVVQVNKRHSCEPQLSYSVTRKDNVLSKPLHCVTEIPEIHDRKMNVEKRGERRSSVTKVETLTNIVEEVNSDN